MKHTTSSDIELDPSLSLRVRRACQILEEVIGPTARSTTASWSLQRDANNRKVVQLILADFIGTKAETSLISDELAHDEILRAKFYRVWGDLLQYRSHQQLNQLSGSVGLTVSGH